MRRTFYLLLAAFVVSCSSELPYKGQFEMQNGLGETTEIEYFIFQSGDHVTLNENQLSKICEVVREKSMDVCNNPGTFVPKKITIHERKENETWEASVDFIAANTFGVKDVSYLTIVFDKELNFIKSF